MDYEIINPYEKNPSSPKTKTNPMFIPPTQKGWKPTLQNGLGGAIGMGESLVGGATGWFISKSIADDPLIVQGATTLSTGLFGVGGMYLHSRFEEKNANYKQRMRGQLWGTGIATLLSLGAFFIEGMNSLGWIDTFGKTRFIPMGQVEEDEEVEIEKGFLDKVGDFFTDVGKTLLSPFNAYGLLGSNQYNFSMQEVEEDFAQQVTDKAGGLAQITSDDILDEAGGMAHMKAEDVVEEELGMSAISPEQIAEEGIGFRGTPASDIVEEELGMEGIHPEEIVEEEMGIGKNDQATLGIEAVSIAGFGRASEYVDNRFYEDVTDYETYPELNSLGLGDMMTEAKKSVLEIVEDTSDKVSKTAKTWLNPMSASEDWYGKVEALEGIDLDALDEHELQKVEAMLDRTLAEAGLE